MIAGQPEMKILRTKPTSHHSTEVGPTQRLEEPVLYVWRHHRHRDLGVMDDVFTHTPQHRATDHSVTARPHHDHVGVVFLGRLDDELPSLADLEVNASLDRERL